jgi:tellurite methyltransferase
MIDDTIAALGRTDVYLLDQFMKGRFEPNQRVLDAGCGSGRNLDLFLRAGHEVTVLDESATAVEKTRAHAASLGHALPADRLHHGRIEDADLRPFDVVLSIAVLHFARDPAHWHAMVDALWRHVAPGGTFFARLSTTIGIEDHIEPLGGGRYRLGTGVEWFLVSLDDLLAATERLGAELLEPVKTVNVQNRRCMTTWVLRSPR